MFSTENRIVSSNDFFQTVGDSRAMREFAVLRLCCQRSNTLHRTDPLRSACGHSYPYRNRKGRAAKAEEHQSVRISIALAGQI